MRVLERLHKDLDLVDDTHPHSFITEALRLNVLEYDLYFKLNSNYMSAWAALTAHPNINIKTSIGAFNKLCKDVRNTIPYIRYQKVEDKLDSELQKAIDQFKQMEKETSNGGQG